MFNVDANYNVTQDTAQFFSTQMLTREWVDPVDQLHFLYPASTDIKDDKGHVLVTAYSLRRPDQQWSLLLVNKDQANPHSVVVEFHDSSKHSDHYFQGTVKQVSFGADNYVWHAGGRNGYADPDGPAVESDQSGGKGVEYTLPKASITVLKGMVQ